ncbi:MAG: hypothetical protein NTY87_01465 [Planctomycetia bacterium]|nr:hypothetical protein [Planctomycetia bacterium]
MLFIARVGLSTVMVLLACGAAIDAAPFEQSHVAADAKWMMHFDMDTARESTVVQRAYAMAVKMHPQAEKMLGMVSGMLGMDPRKDLHDATVYGLDTDKQNAIIIVHANANREFLTTMVERAVDHAKTSYGSYELHSWTHKGWNRDYSGPAVGAFFKDNIIVFARTQAAVKAALDVLDGSAKSIKDSDSMLAGRIRPGSILIGRASVVDPKTRCPVLKEGSSFRVALGENNETIFYRATLQMKTATAAEQVKDVVKGFTSLASLKYGDDQKAIGLVKAIAVKTDAKTCSIRWDAAAVDVWQVMETAATKWEQRRKEWSNRGRMNGAKKGGGCKSCGKDGCQECSGDKKCPLDTEHLGGKNAERPLGDDEF